VAYSVLFACSAIVTAYYSADGRCTHKIRDRLAKPPGMGRSDHLEIALIVEDVPGPILLR
jgi:hypothetical protein